MEFNNKMEEVYEDLFGIRGPEAKIERLKFLKSTLKTQSDDIGKTVNLNRINYLKNSNRLLMEVIKELERKLEGYY